MPATWNPEKAREMIEAGVSYTKVGAHFGMTGTTVKRRLDPEFAEHCRIKSQGWESNKRRKELRASLVASKKGGQRRAAGIERSARSGSEAEESWRRWLNNLPNTPRDDRNITGIIMGDPPSWRSALASRQRGT